MNPCHSNPQRSSRPSGRGLAPLGLGRLCGSTSSHLPPIPIPVYRPSRACWQFLALAWAVFLCGFLPPVLTHGRAGFVSGLAAGAAAIVLIPITASILWVILIKP